MKNRILSFVFAVLILLTSLPVPAFGDGALSFVKGQKLVLFDQAGVKLTLTGEVEDSGLMFIELKAIIENTGDEAVRICYSGTVNGWSIGSSYMGGSSMDVAAKAKAKAYLWIKYEDADITRFGELTGAALNFTIENTSGKALATVPGVEIVFNGGEAQAPEETFFDEVPSLLTPLAYGVYKSGSSSSTSTINGVTTVRATYHYKSSSGDLKQALEAYIRAIKAKGLKVSGSGSSYTVMEGSAQVAAISLSGDTLTVELTPHGSTSGRTQSTAQTAQAADKKIGDTLSASYMEMKLEKSGTDSKLYSYTSRKPSRWKYYEAKSGSTFIWIRGSFTNHTGRSVDIRNIYTEATLDGKNVYDGHVSALAADGSGFENTVAAEDTVEYLIYFEVPQKTASFKSCTVRLGFTETFNTKVRRNGSYDFGRCDSVFSISLPAGGSAPKPTATPKATKKGKATATPKPAGKAEAAATPEPAEETERGEITFQGIPWFSSPDKTRGALVKAKYIKSKGAAGSFHSAVYGMMFDGAKNTYALTSAYEKVLTGDSIYNNKILKQIAGYDVDSIGILYAYGINKKGKLDKKNVQLISVNVELNATDKDAAMADLAAKLEKVYGPCDYAASYGGTKVWYGANGTRLMLYNFFMPTLLYACGDNLAMVQQLYADLGYTADEGDLSGL